MKSFMKKISNFGKKGGTNENIRKKVLSWPGVKEKYSNYSYIKAFFVSKEEFAHFHNPNELDFRLPYKRYNKIKGGAKILILQNG